MAAKKGLTNLQFIDFVNREGVKTFMNVTDAVFVCYKNVRILETGCPNKYFDGLASGKIMIVNFGGWIRDEMEQKGCGVYVDPEQPGDFEKRILPLVSDPGRQKSFRVASRALAEEKYSRRLLGEAFAGLF